MPPQIPLVKNPRFLIENWLLPESFFRRKLVRLKWNLGNPKVEMNLCEWIFYGTASEKVFKLSWIKADEGPYTLSYEAVFYTKNEMAMAKVNTFFKALLRGTRKVKIYGKGTVCP